MTSKFLKLFTLFVFASALLVSCNKEEVEPQTETPVVETPVDNTDDEENDAEEGSVTPPTTNNSGQINAMVTATETEGCYVIDFPITFIYEDGSTVTAETEADLETIFGEGAASYPWEIGFPVNLTDPETGETVSAANEEELFTYFMECEGFDEEWDEEDDEDEDEDEDDEDNPWDEGENPCDSLDFGFGTIACYDLVFPVNFVLEDGTTVTAENEDALGDIFLNNGPANFAYPISLEDEDGEIQVANSEEELFELLEECVYFNGDDWDEEDDDEWSESVVYPLTFMSIAIGGPGTPQNCYTYVYPITLTNEDGELFTTNSDEEIIEIIFTNNEITDYIYPVSVVDVTTGETIIVNNEEEALALVLACEG